MELRGRKIYREREGRTLAGLCAGLGAYLEVDPVFVRLVWVAVTCLTGVLPGVLAYVVGWVVVPERPAPFTATAPEESSPPA